MPRDSNGSFSLVAGNPVTPGDVISSTWANNTMNDLATGMTDSLDRNGRGGMLAPFQFADGSVLAPGATWTNEQTTGLYRFDGGDLRVTILTQDVFRFQQSGVQVWNTTDLAWESVLTNGGAAGLVAVPAGAADGERLEWDQTTDQEWKVVAGAAGGNLPLGTNGQTLRWDETTNQVWEASSALTISDAANVVIGNRILSPDGTAADPVYGFSGDLNMGVFRKAADTIGWATAGVEVMSLDAAGDLLVANEVTAATYFGDGSNLTGLASSPVTTVFTRAGDIVALAGDYAAFYATLAQGVLADTATQPADNISTLTNDSGFTPSTGFTDMESLTQATYDGLTPDANTMYFIVG